MIDMRNVKITIKNNNRRLLNDFNFTLNEGDKAVIIGEEGNGKSTLLKLIYDEKLIESYCWFSGQIIKNNFYLGYLGQEMDRQWNDCSIYEFLARDNPLSDVYSPLFDYSLLASILSDLEIKASIIQSEQRMGSLSGGEKIKIQLAKILLRNPDVLLLDEPTNDLDLDTLKWLENFTINTQLPALFISHDETFIENTANLIIHLEQIKKKSEARHSIKKMNYREYIKKRNFMLQKQEQVARKQRVEHRTRMKQWNQLYNKVDYQQQTITRANPAGGRLLKKKMKSLKSQENRFKEKADDFLDIPDVEEAIHINFDKVDIANGKTVLDLSLDVLNAGDKILAKNIKLFVSGAEHIAIIGDNGVGKTTLLKEIYRHLQSRNDLKVSYMPQNYQEKLNYNETALEYLVASGKKEEITRACIYLGNMKFTYQEMNQKIKELSGGQKAKLLFLEMVLNEYDVLLLDEPTRNFSSLSNPVLRDGLAQYNGVIISISHDRKYIKAVCNSIYKLTSDGLKEVILA